MAMGVCRECGKEVSTRAAKCPHCGMSNSGQTKAARSIGAFIVLGIIGFIVFKLMSASSEDDRINAEHPGYYHTADGVLYPKDCTATARVKMTDADCSACVRYSHFDFAKPIIVQAGAGVCVSSAELTLYEQGSPARCMRWPTTARVTELSTEILAQHTQVRISDGSGITDGWVSNRYLMND
jgi:hypothetical protein